MGNIIDKQLIKEKQRGLIRAASWLSIDHVREYLNDDTVDVNWKDSIGFTALHYACMNGNRDIAELLLDSGADIDARSNSNETPLMMACSSTIKLLLDRGCAINAVDDDGYTALHLACWRGSTECVKELLAHGADTTIKNRFGKTPMDMAIQENDQDVIHLLMGNEERSKDTLNDIMSGLSRLEATIKNRYGKTPMDVAKEENDQDVINLLMEHEERSKDTLNNIASEVSRLKAGEASSSKEERLISKDETIMGRRCEEQKKINRNALSQSEMHSKISSIERELSSIIERELSSMKIGMTQIQEELDSMKIGMTQIDEDQNTMTGGNLERMNPSLQTLTGNHFIVSNAFGGPLLLLGLVLNRRRRRIHL